MNSRNSRLQIATLMANLFTPPHMSVVTNRRLPFDILSPEGLSRRFRFTILKPKNEICKYTTHSTQQHLTKCSQKAEVLLVASPWNVSLRSKKEDARCHGRKGCDPLFQSPSSSSNHALQNLVRNMTSGRACHSPQGSLTTGGRQPEKLIPLIVPHPCLCAREITSFLLSFKLLQHKSSTRLFFHLVDADGRARVRERKDLKLEGNYFWWLKNIPKLKQVH
ncbi:hypothetical protein NPIL_405361 [Nephila pilipes]|uniref:Uncharacterized protein n=1 Tax=Nephila pilipes TaxID=299642 RepID=A0A8X6QS17_NEPPI|nr:hypothetical protein NPIL_405361 [Nephila pilipes]